MNHSQLNVDPLLNKHLGLEETLGTGKYSIYGSYKPSVKDSQYTQTTEQV